MRCTVALGSAVVGIFVAVACSSNGTNTPVNAGGDGGGGGDAGCTGYTVSAAAGQTYVQKEGCAECHGANLAGTSIALVNDQEPGLTVIGNDKLYPPNLTSDPATGLGNWTVLEIYYAITEGIDNEGLDLCPEMGRHYPNMCANEANAIVAYLQSPLLPPVVNCVPESYCPPLKNGGPGACAEDGGL
jgi:hypothetical protein